MTANEFRNALLLLNCITSDEFTDEMFDPGSHWADPQPLVAWRMFRENPLEFYIRADDHERNALWRP